MDLPTFLGTAFVIVTVIGIVAFMCFWGYDVFRNPGGYRGGP